MVITDEMGKDSLEGELAEVGPGDLRTDVPDPPWCVTSALVGKLGVELSSAILDPLELLRKTSSLPSLVASLLLSVLLLKITRG